MAGLTGGSISGERVFGGGDAYLTKYDGDGNQLWARQFGSQFLDQASGVAVDTGGNVYVAGITWGTLRGQDHFGGRDGFVKGYDSDGNELWTRQIGTPGYDVATGVAVDGAGNVYVVGDTHETFPGQTNLGKYDAYLRKYDSSGSEVWTRQFGSQHFDMASAVAADGSGNLYVVGWTRGTLPGQAHLGDFDAFVHMYDANGNELRSHQFGAQHKELASDLVLDGLGNLYMAGFTDGALNIQLSSGRRDAFAVKMPGVPQPSPIPSPRPVPAAKAAPDMLWTRQFGSTGSDTAHNVAVDTAGNVYVVGDTLGILPGQNALGRRDAYLRKYDSDGNELWTRQFGTQSVDTGTDVAIDNRGYIYVAGSTSGAFGGHTKVGESDAYLRKYDSEGNELWTRQFGTEGDDEVGGLGLDGADNVYLVGQTRLFISEVASLNESAEVFTAKSTFLRKYDSSGNELWARRFPTQSAETAWDVAVDGPGTVYVVGETLLIPSRDSLEGQDAFVRTYDSDGNRSWTRQFGIQDADRASGVWVDGAGKVYVVGYTAGAFPGKHSMGHRDAYLRGYDGAGTELETIQFGTEGHDSAIDVAVDPAGNIYVVGRTEGTFPGQANLGEGDVYLRKYDNDGNELWTRQFGTRLNDTVNDVALDDAGQLYVVGKTKGTLPGQTSFGNSDAFVVKIASSP